MCKDLILNINDLINVFNKVHYISHEYTLKKTVFICHSKMPMFELWKPTKNT